MSEKIPLGGGAYLEPDEEPRNSPFHKRILHSAPIPNTKTGRFAHLECGHTVQTFGDLAHAHGVVLCEQCRQGYRP